MSEYECVDSVETLTKTLERVKNAQKKFSKYSQRYSLFYNIQKASEIGFLRRFLGLFCVTVKFRANSHPGPR